MTPRDYYYKYFRKDFQNFITINEPHSHGEDDYIIIGQLGHDKVTKAVGAYAPDFYCCMAFTVLIDQFMYSHFRYDYMKFKSLTMYPKVELGITNYLVHPWRLVALDVSRDKFSAYADFFIEDYREFFSTQDFHKATWENVKKALFEDKDISNTWMGSIFLEKLKESLTRATYKIYIIQLGIDQTKLLINYTVGNIEDKFLKFKYEHPALRVGSRLRPELYEKLPEFKIQNDCLNACRVQIKKLEDKGFEIIASTPLYNNYYSVYVLKLNGDDKFVYVGQTNYSPEIRLKQHMYHFNQSAKLKKIKKLELYPELYEQLPRLKTRDEALSAEAKLAEDLKKKGYKVLGGH